MTTLSLCKDYQEMNEGYGEVLRLNGGHENRMGLDQSRLLAVDEAHKLAELLPNFIGELVIRRPHDLGNDRYKPLSEAGDGLIT